jgi:hypothetical protein
LLFQQLPSTSLHTLKTNLGYLEMPSNLHIILSQTFSQCSACIWVFNLKCPPALQNACPRPCSCLQNP